MKPVTIETANMTLLGYTPQDMSYIFENYTRAEIMRTLGHSSEEDYLSEEHKYRAGYASYNRSFLLFLLACKPDGTIIGRCGLHNWNKDHLRAEVGYVMHADAYKRKGLMSEALGAILDYGFRNLDLHRIEALVSSYNEPSRKLLQKYGFVQEGIMREHYLVNGQFEDSLVYSKLRREHILGQAAAM